MEYWGKTTLFYISRRKREVRRSLVDVLNTSLWSAEQWCWAKWATKDQIRPKNVDSLQKHDDSPQSIPTDWSFNSTAVTVASEMECRIPKRWVCGCWTQSWLRQVFSSSAIGGWRDSSYHTNESVSSSSVLWVCLCVRFIYFLLPTYSSTPRVESTPMCVCRPPDIWKSFWWISFQLNVVVWCGPRARRCLIGSSSRQYVFQSMIHSFLRPTWTGCYHGSVIDLSWLCVAVLLF